MKNKRTRWVDIMIYKVILDTNIYIASNYKFHNEIFSALREKSALGELELLINAVIEGEVEAHIKREVKQAAKELLKAASKAKIAVEANCKVKVYYRYTDENQSFYDKDDHAYLWERIVEHEDIYGLPVNFVLNVAISEYAPEDDEVEDCVECVGLLDIPERIDFEEDWLIERNVLSDSGAWDSSDSEQLYSCYR